MLWRSALLAALLASVQCGVEAKAPSMNHAKAHKERVKKRQEKVSSLVKRQTPPPSDFSNSPYYNNNTAKFAVDGAGFPNITFDIGESYAGLLPMDSSDKELFFWFVPSPNPEATDEIMVWLNGGPGCSSLDGFFKENGPVLWQTGTYGPVRNRYSWSNLTNTVWIEQPVGTGYSQGTPNATSEADVAQQFMGFWKNFMDLFELQDRKVYVTGESYAGMYVPYIAEAMLQQNDTTYFDVNGIMFYDPSIGDDAITEQVPTAAFVDYHHQLFPFNDTFREQIHAQSKACGYDEFLENGLTFPPAGPFPPPPGLRPNGRVRRECDVFDDVFNEIFELNPCFNIYQVGQLCPIPFDVEGFPYSDFYLPPSYPEPYFNNTLVKQLLHVNLDTDWKICSDIDVFVNGTDTSPPSALNGGPVAYVAERTNNVIIGHGIMDMVLFMNGSLLTLQNLTWNGAQGFSEPPLKPFYVPAHPEDDEAQLSGHGILGNWVSERGLTFVTIELAGHTVPSYQQAAAYRHIELLLGRIEDFSEVSSFTTQRGYPQPSVNLTEGIGPNDIGPERRRERVVRKRGRRQRSFG